MELKLRWRRGDRTATGAQDSRKELLRRLQAVPYYSSPERVRQLAAGCLDAMVPVELTEFIENQALFESSRRHTPATFEYPSSPVPRTAVLRDGFRSGGAVQVFAQGWSEAARRFEPETIAASVAELNRLARAALSGSLTLPRLHHAAVALIAIGDNLPTDSERDLWWEAFEVPVFESVVGPSGVALATDCEAREGLHVHADRVIFELDDEELLVTPLVASVARLRTGWTCRLDAGACACGRSGTRLVDLKPMVVQEQIVAQAC